MYLEEILKHLRTGGAIRRLCWPENTYIQMVVLEYPSTTILKYNKISNGGRFYKPTTADILANDWIVYLDY